MIRGEHYRRLVFALAVSVGVSFGSILYGTSVLITADAAGADFSISHLSMAFSGSVLSGAALAVPVGKYADRRGVRGLIASGGGLVMVGFLVFSLSTEEWHVLLAWWLFIGPGSAMVLFEPAFVSIQQWFPRPMRNRAAGTLTLITGLAGPVFIPSTLYLVEGLGWRPTAALLGAVVFAVSGLTSLWALRIAPHPRRHPAGAQSAEPAQAAAPRWRIPRGFIPLSLSVALTMAVLEAYNIHRIARFEAEGFNPEVLAWWAGAVGILSLPARFFLPRLANRFDSATLWMWLTVLIMPAVWLSIRGTEVWEMNGHFILFGLLFGAFMPLRAVVMSDWYSGARFGALMGVQAIAMAGGRSGGPALVGWLADTRLGYSAAMTLLAGLLVLSLLAMLTAVVRHGPAERPDPVTELPSTPPLEAVKKVQGTLSRAGIPTAVGGSGLLVSLGLIDRAHDWDLVTDGEPEEVRSVIEGLGLAYRTKGPMGVYRSAAVFTIDAGDHEIKVLVQFCLASAGRAVSIPARRGHTWNGLVMARPQEWATAYRLMGRTQRAELLDSRC